MKNVIVTIEGKQRTRTVSLFFEEVCNGIVTNLRIENGELLRDEFSVTNIRPLDVKPMLELPDYMFKALGIAVTEHLKNKEGVNTNKSYLEGKLEATEKHLDDLRGYYSHIFDNHFVDSMEYRKLNKVATPPVPPENTKEPIA